ncbi:MAG: tetratricopeptide repeat protein [Gemmataceae bacterium]|nr:tetratricopeptide repeat protein [Gemmataceae bacterium]
MGATEAAPRIAPSRFQAASGLLILAVLAYVPALSGGFIWDDDFYVTANPTLRSWPGLARIWFEPGATPQYYPLTFTTFWAEYQLWELAPLGYHVINVLLHGVNGVLLWHVLMRLRAPAPWFVAAVFVLHPVHVESVAWITERKNVLSTLLYFAAALSYLQFSPPAAGEEVRSRSRWYVLALALFAGALLSKTVACSLPAALLLALWWRRGRFPWGDLAALTPFFALGALLAAVTIWMEKHHVGAQGLGFELSPVERCLIAGRALCFYAAKLVWPADLTFIYPRWQVDAGVWWQYVFPLATIGAAVSLAAARRRIGWGPLVAYLIFAGTLVPALGFIDVYPMRFSFVADHFVYLASPAFLALALAAIQALWQRLPQSWNNVRRLAPVGCLLLLGALTWRHGFVFTDPRTLWEDTLSKNPECWMAHNNLGELLAGQGRPDLARPHYEAAIRLYPHDAAHHHNLGKAHFLMGDLEKAAPAYEAALQVDPSHFESHFSLGVVLRRLGKLPDARRHLETAVALRPDFAAAHNNLGALLAQQDQHAEAIEHFRAAARSAPADPAAYFNLAIAHTRLGKLDEAIDYVRQALERAPGEESFRQLLGALLRERELTRQPAK